MANHHWEHTPKASGAYRREKPNISSGLLAIIMLCVVFAVIGLAMWLTPPLLH